MTDYYVEVNNPVEILNMPQGFTLREWYAGLAMQGMLAARDYGTDETWLGREAVRHADALIRALEAEDDRPSQTQAPTD